MSGVEVPGAGRRDGLLIVDKAAGCTSHDVVARVRRILQTRRVGHAGTLDPLATGVLVVGVGRGTKFLTFLVGADKSYDATIRLGESTGTDDADGEILATSDASAVTKPAVLQAVSALTGDIFQVPSAVSAIKVDGRRAYVRVRAGEALELAARAVRVARFDVAGMRRCGQCVDVDVQVEVSSGTYVRALGRDLGAALGVGGHLTSLRRTGVGPFGVGEARTVEQIAEVPDLLALPDAARRLLPVRQLDADETRRLRFGQPLAATGTGPAPVAAISPDGALIAVVADRVPGPAPDLAAEPAPDRAAEPGADRAAEPGADRAAEPGAQQDAQCRPLVVFAPA